MSEPSTVSDTLAAARSHFAEALAYLEANGIDVMLDGDPLRYEVAGRFMTEGDLVALAARIVPAAGLRRGVPTLRSPSTGGLPLAMGALR